MLRWIGAVTLGFVVAAAGAWAGEVPVPEDYRQSGYRAPVPDLAPGALTINDKTAHALWWSGAVAFVDVMPDIPKPKGLSEDTVWQGRSRFSVPGAIWLPDTGAGSPDAETLAYFQPGLTQATEGNKASPVVIFCQAECWMSWNAARRAAKLGYERVYWYPDGTDGWIAQGWPTKKLKRFQQQ